MADGAANSDSDVDGAPSGDVCTITPRARPCSGVVAAYDQQNVVIAELELGKAGLRIGKHAVLRNGVDDVKWELTDADSVAAALVSAAGSARVSKSFVALALPQPEVGVQHVVLPRVKGAIRAALLARRMKEIAGEQLDDWAVEALDLRAPAAASPAPNALLAWAPWRWMQSLQVALDQQGIRTRRALPPLLAWVDLLERSREPGSTEAEIFVHASLPALSLVVFDGEVILYARLLRDATNGAPENLPDILLTELQRTTGFFRENHRGRRIARVVLSGFSADHASRLCPWLAASAALPCVPLRVVGSADEASMALEPWLPVLVGLLCHHDRAATATSAPADLFVRKPARVRKLLPLAAAALALIGGSAWFRTRLHERARHAGTQVATIESVLTNLESKSELRASALDAERRSEMETRALALLGVRAGNGSRNAVEPLLETMMLVPSDVELVSSKLVAPSSSELARPEPPPPRRLELLLRGDLTAGPESVQRFVAALESRPWCAKVAVSAEPGGMEESAGSSDDQVKIEVTLQ